MLSSIEFEILLHIIKNYKKLIENYSTISIDNLESKLLKDQFPYNLDLDMINIFLKKYKKMMTTTKKIKHK